MNIDSKVGNNHINNAISDCTDNKLFYLGCLLGKILHKDSNYISNEYKKCLQNIKKNDIYLSDIEKNNMKTDDKILVLLTCNWLPNEDICNLWNKMSTNNDFTWKNVKIVSKEPCHYYCIINSPFDKNLAYIPQKTILFRMEPHMKSNEHFWGSYWSDPPNKDDFLFYGDHSNKFNNNEWHLSKTYNQLCNENIEKSSSLSCILSTILSDKYNDPGHKKRIDFMKFVESKNTLIVHVFGGNYFKWNNYKGSLPLHNKDDSLLPYKYSFNVENFSIKNYYTEKIIDGILAETLVFYSGCPNIKDFFDERAFVYLELIDFEKDYQTIKNAIDNDLWKERLPYIKQAKNKILNNLQFFPRIHEILNVK